MITVTLIGFDNVQSVVTIIGNTTVRDVDTTKYDPTWAARKEKLHICFPFYDAEHRRDRVTVEQMRYRD